MQTTTGRKIEAPSVIQMQITQHGGGRQLFIIWNNDAVSRETCYYRTMCDNYVENRSLFIMKFSTHLQHFAPIQNKLCVHLFAMLMIQFASGPRCSPIGQTNIQLAGSLAVVLLVNI
jgi:hypothetical protein